MLGIANLENDTFPYQKILKQEEKMSNLKDTAAAANSKGKRSFKDWVFTNRIYFLAFFVPVIIMYVTYALFKFFPFGDGCVLVLDLNGQYVYYFEYARQAFWGDGSLLYSWSRNLSGEFMGIIGYYLASPFTLIVMLLPQSMILGSLLIMQLAKIGAIGVTFSYYLQKSYKIKPLNSVLFSTLFALCAYAVIQLMDPMWLDGLVFMPLMMLGIQKIIDEGKKVNFIIPTAIMFFANFYIGFMLVIFSVIYFIYYIIFGTKEKQCVSSVVKSLIRFGVSGIVAAMMACTMLLPVYYSLKLGKFEFTDPDYSLKFQFQSLDLLSKLLPSSYDTVRNEGLPEIYCGTLTMLMVPLFFMNEKITAKKKAGFAILSAVMFFSMYVKPIDMLWHGGQVPNWLPYRYSFIFSFILVTMAAIAFENIGGIKTSSIGGTFAGIILYLMYAETKEYENIDILGAIWFTAGCIALFAYMVNCYKKSPNSRAIPIAMLVLISGELVVSSLETIKDIDTDVAYSKRQAYIDYISAGREATDALDDYDDSLYRAEKTFHRTVNDNLAFGLKGITHSSSVMNSKAIDFLGHMGYSNRGHYTRYNGATTITDGLLGIKYVLDKENKVESTYKENKVLTSDDITVYENKYALPIAYMVDDDVLDTYIESENPFENQNNFLSSIMGERYEYFTRVMPDDMKYKNVTTADAGNQTKYMATENMDSTIEFLITSPNQNPMYLFFPSASEKKVNLWLSTAFDEETQAFTGHEFLNYFFETQYYAIQKIGDFEANQQFSLICTIANEYAFMKDQWFYTLDQNAVEASLTKLQEGAMNITKWSDTHIEGNVTAQDGQILMTTIPEEGGWTIKVDGKKVEPVTIAGALIGIPVSAGSHEIEMKFFPQGLALGIVLFIIGAVVTVIFYLSDYKKLDKVIANLKGTNKAKK